MVNTICTISIVNKNSQRMMKPDNFSSRRPQRTWTTGDYWEQLPSHHTMDSFEEVELRGNPLWGVSTYRYEKPSLGQRRAIVPYIKGYDVIAQSHCREAVAHISFAEDECQQEGDSGYHPDTQLGGLPRQIQKVEIQKTWPPTSVQMLPAVLKDQKYELFVNCRPTFKWSYCH